MSLTLRNLAGLAAGTTLALAAAAPAQGDPIEEQIREGLKLYQGGELGAAVTELEFAIGDIRKAMSGQLGDTFPPAPAGWTAADAGSAADAGAAAAMFGGIMGTMLERAYNQTDGNGAMTAKLMIDNPMVQGMAALLNNPMLMAAQPDIQRLRVGRETGMLKWDPDSATAEATLLLDGRILMQVSGEDLASPDIAADLLKAWDIEAVRERTAR